MNTSYKLDGGELHIDFDMYDPDDGGGLEVNSICAAGSVVEIKDILSADFMSLIEAHCYKSADHQYREAQYDRAEAIYESRRGR